MDTEKRGAFLQAMTVFLRACIPHKEQHKNTAKNENPCCSLYCGKSVLGKTKSDYKP